MSHAAIIVALDRKVITPKSSKAKVNAAIGHEMHPFDEAGDFFKDGTRWDWWVIGGRYTGRFAPHPDYVRKGDLDLDRMEQARIKEITKQWAEIKKEKDRGNPFYTKIPDTLEEWIGKRAGKPSAYAFLVNRHWHENERMGWFGMSHTTECEVASPHNATTTEEVKGKCVVKDKKTGAQIINWAVDDANWTAKYWDRFIAPLHDDTILAVVDFHV